MTAWAEVIGDPIAHSLSPSIHRYWLEKLGISGRFEATRLPPTELAGFFARRAPDRDWRGCNVTAPHKEQVAKLLDRVDEAAEAVGAVNCVYRAGSGLTGTNTDAEGVGEALGGVPVRGGKVVVLGAGGGARAALHCLRQRGAGEILLVVRRPENARALGARTLPFTAAEAALASATLVINATPLGLEGGAQMPRDLLTAVRGSGAAAAFDMVYRPLDTAFLVAARQGGARPIDGLAMLIGQARRAFRLFFDSDPPPGTDDELRRCLAAG